MYYLSKNIKFLRLSQGLTQTELGKHTGIGAWSKIASYEKGTSPKIEGLIALADFFGYSVDELIREDLTKGKQPTKAPILSTEPDPTSMNEEHTEEYLNLKLEEIELKKRILKLKAGASRKE